MRQYSNYLTFLKQGYFMQVSGNLIPLIFRFYVDIAYDVLVDSTAEIKQIFAGDLCGIANSLRQLKVISEGQKQNITDKYCGQTESERLDRLLNQLKTAVAVDGSVFDSFIEILKEIDTVPASWLAQNLLFRYNQKESQFSDGFCLVKRIKY